MGPSNRAIDLHLWVDSACSSFREAVVRRAPDVKRRQAMSNDSSLTYVVAPGCRSMSALKAVAVVPRQNRGRRHYLESWDPCPRARRSGEQRRPAGRCRTSPEGSNRGEHPRWCSRPISPPRASPIQGSRGVTRSANVMTISLPSVRTSAKTGRGGGPGPAACRAQFRLDCGDSSTH